MPLVEEISKVKSPLHTDLPKQFGKIFKRMTQSREIKTPPPWINKVPNISISSYATIRSSEERIFFATTPYEQPLTNDKYNLKSEYNWKSCKSQKGQNTYNKHFQSSILFLKTIPGFTTYITGT